MTIQKIFAYHKPGTQALMDINSLREAFSRLDEHIRMTCPDSRERAIALTEIETAAMWAIKSVVFHDPHSEASY